MSVAHRDPMRPSVRLTSPFGALFRTNPPKPPKPSKPTKPAPKKLVLKGQCSRFSRIAAFSSIYGFRQIAFLRQRSGFWRAIIHEFRRFRRFREFRKFHYHPIGFSRRGAERQSSQRTSNFRSLLSLMQTALKFLDEKINFFSCSLCALCVSA